jgi:YidC/Oxa1 family membrane protein insertase
MDRRTVLALVLMALVIVVTPMLFPASRQPAPAVHDSTNAAPAIGDTSRNAALGTPPQNALSASKPPSTAPQASPSMNGPRAAATESVTVTTPRAQYVYLNPGAAPAAVKIADYTSLRPGARGAPLVVAPTRGPLLHYRLAVGNDTIALDTIHFAVTTAGASVTFASASPALTISYDAVDSRRTAVRGTLSNATGPAALLIDLPTDLRSSEADTLDDQRHLAYGYKIPLRDPASVAFSKLNVNSVTLDTGSFQWVNARDKYWLISLMQPVAATGTTVKAAGVFRDLVMRGGVRVGRVAPTAYATTVYPIAGGRIAFDMYVGPQKWNELHALGNDLENANPYAGILHAVVQPFATIMMKVLLWMKATLHVNYGWVLVLLGIVIRLALWPLNQRAMRSSIQMQRLQPELAETQKKYKSDPEKQREAIMKLYSSHGMSPLSPMLGCLPMLLPMPILYALYFVFQNTIEFRGVSFLWLPDISLRDPYYIIPLVMGASMFLLSWIGMRAMPPNPQAKMMSYMMPVMFTAMFLNFASGLNLYYAVQNIAALPQQWFLTKERAKAGVATPLPRSPAERRARE